MLGIETKGCDGKEIPLHYEQENYHEIELHNKEDVLSTEKIYNYLLENPYNPFKKKIESLFFLRVRARTRLFDRDGTERFGWHAGDPQRPRARN